MAQLFRNNAFSSLGASLTNVATTLTVTAGHGDRFPVVTAPDFCLLTLQDASNNIEIVKVTARTAGSDSMTIVRAQEGTTARSWNLGDVVELRLTAFALNPLSLLEGASTASAIRAAIGAGTGNGDVTGPGSSTANAIPVFSGTSGKVIASSALTFDGQTLLASSSTAFYPQIVQVNKTNDANAAQVVLDKDRAGAVVQNGDALGNIVFRGYDGTGYHQAAAIMAVVDGTPGNNDMPGRLDFLTTADGASSPTLRLRINNAGRFQVNGAQDCNVVDIASGTNFDLSAGNYFIRTVNGNVTFTVSNVPASRAYAFTVEITHTSGTITWFSGVVWPGGTAPTLTTGRVHLFTFVTDNGGTTWRAVANINYTS